MLAVIGEWTIVQVLIAIIVIAAAVGIMYAALQYFGVAIPPIVVRIFWIVVIAVVAIVAIKFIVGIL